MKNGSTFGVALAVGGTFAALVVVGLALNISPSARSAGSEETGARDFETMAVAPDKVVECQEPKAPSELGNVPLQNTYALIARIIALEKAKAVGVCACPYGQENWDQVVEAAPDFERTDGAQVRFDMMKLRLRGDALQAELKLVCAG